MLPPSSSRRQVTAARRVPTPPSARSVDEFVSASVAVEWAAVLRWAPRHSVAAPPAAQAWAPQFTIRRSRPTDISKLRVPACAERS